MPKLITITPNPAVDKSYQVPGFRAGQVQRARAVRTTSGGKGINAARVLRTLAADVLALGFAGGATGDVLRTGLLSEGLPAEFVDVSPAETRLAILLLDTESAEQTVVNEPGPELAETDLLRLMDIVRSRIEPGGFALFCGSLPPGLPDESYRRLIDAVSEVGARSLVDCTGPALRAALLAHPDVVKINRYELGDFGYEIEDWNKDGPSVVEQFREVSAVRIAVVTDGGNGAIAAAGYRGIYAAAAPKLEVVSAVGSGDSFAAGLAYALCESPDDIASALRLAGACGGANALNEGAGYLTTEQIEAVSGRMQIAKMA